MAVLASSNTSASFVLVRHTKRRVSSSHPAPLGIWRDIEWKNSYENGPSMVEPCREPKVELPLVRLTTR